MSEIKKSFLDISQNITSACKTYSRDRSEVHLLAVSKLQSVDLIRAAYEIGQRDFGENYVQELLEKKRELSDLKDIRWHLIGPLQSNKIKLICNQIDYFHALESERQVEEFSKRIKVSGSKPVAVFIQVNIDQEQTKSGVDPENLLNFAATVSSCGELRLAGLMCIPEPKPDMGTTFQKMRSLLKTLPGNEKMQLSMGMSEDYTSAIRYGANWVRIGRSLFGDRK